MGGRLSQVIRNLTLPRLLPSSLPLQELSPLSTVWSSYSTTSYGEVENLHLRELPGRPQRQSHALPL